MPNRQCPDGKTMAGPACTKKPDGKCGWVIIDCPK
jgi:hypothetical protein